MISRFGSSLILLVWLAVSSAALQAEDKDAQLRKILGAAEGTPITVSLKPALPAATPLKVALAFGLDAGVTRNFVQWVAQWNKSGDARKYGAIDLVEDVATAEVVLVRFVDRSTVAGTSTSGRVTNYGVLSAGSSSSSTMLPVYAYIVARKATRFEVVGGYEDTTSAESSATTGENLWTQMRNLMKGRPKLR